MTYNYAHPKAPNMPNTSQYHGVDANVNYSVSAEGAFLS